MVDATQGSQLKTPLGPVVHVASVGARGRSRVAPGMGAALLRNQGVSLDAFIHR